MATRIQPKRSTTPNSKPQVADLRNNEIALNIPDRKLFINNNGTVEELLNGAPNDETIIPSMFVQSSRMVLGMNGLFQRMVQIKHR